MWNGTAPNLNAMPTMTNARPKIRPMLPGPTSRTATASSSSCSVPVTPYTIEKPYSSVPDAIAPSTKYFIADSAATPESRSNATIAYSDSDNSSTPRYTVSRLPAETITITPSNATSASTKNSPRNKPFRCKYSREYSNDTPTVPYENSLSTSPIGSAMNMPSNAVVRASTAYSTVTNAAPTRVSNDNA